MTLTLLFSSVTAAENCNFSEYISPKSLGLKKEKLLHLHFFFHDVARGANVTAESVAQAKTSNASPTRFGFLVIADDPLTIGRDIRSKVVGKAQGLYGFSDRSEISLFMLLNLVFTEGEFSGSSVSMLGRNPIFHKKRELPIVGGTGVFKLARGQAYLKKIILDDDTGVAIVEYNLYVFHY
ncbi:unnamed protein product [Sphenostylis stenocarpa]|uniref:Dirigent protein n=1 Tax=Sphenostylis stenocarpa TaxID=92480 RepID=A0AA86SSB6_9FABA|nr:unnamed protein product [Sphenostylis stenocarpa]